MPSSKVGLSSAGDKAETRATTARPSTSATQGNRRVTFVLATLAFLTLIGLYYLWELVMVPRLGLQRLDIMSMQDRITMALRNQVPAILCLMVSWLYVALTRGMTAAINPLSGNENLVELPNRILTNTLEQVVLSSLNQLILVTWLPEEKLHLLPLISTTFILGRITFAFGYLLNPWWRSYGVTLTIVPTMGMTGYNVWWLTTQGLTTELGSSARS